jgi:hypothetical protein
VNEPNGRREIDARLDPPAEPPADERPAAGASPGARKQRTARKAAKVAVQGERKATRAAHAEQRRAQRELAQAQRAAIRENKARARVERQRRHRDGIAAREAQRHEEEARLVELARQSDWVGLGDQDAVSDAKIVVGYDGWIFLGHDSNRVLLQHTGDLAFTDDELDGWARVLEDRHDWVTRRGAQFLFLIPPNPHSVYPEKLPDEYPLAPRRPVVQLIEHLERRRSPVQVLYPIDELVAVRDSDLIYPRTDSHWTALGAFIAYRALLDTLDPAIPRRVLERDEIEFVEAPFAGGLGIKLDPPLVSTQLAATVRDARAVVVDDNCVRRNGRAIRFECDSAPDVSCVLFGDSFSYAMLRYLAESFRRFLFVHLPTLDREVVEAADADIVISACNERFLIRVPDDATAPTAFDAATAKREAGEVMSPVYAAKESLKLLWP